MINPKNKLWKWGPIDGQVLYIDQFDEIMPGSAKTLGVSWPDCMAHFKDGKILFVLESDKLYNSGDRMFIKYIYNDDNYKKYFKIWSNIKNGLVDNIIKLKHENILSFNDKQLCERLIEFQNLYDDFWNYGFIPELANFGGEKMLKNKILESYENNFIEIFEALSAPEKLSFYQIEERELLQVKLAGANKKDLEKHVDKYYWINNSYGEVKKVKIDDFIDRINEVNIDRAKEKIDEIDKFTENTKAKKSKIISKYKIDNDIQKIALKLSQSIWWQDYRKQYIFMALWAVEIFARELGNRNNIKFSDILYYSRGDLLALAKDGSKIDVKKRKNGFITYFREEERDLVYYYGNEANELISKYTEEVDRKNVDEIKGLVVSKGKVKGRVKLLSSARHFDSFRDGQILVTSMTSPEYIVAMRRAAAIITDEGGMTSHAAIVSRELGIPCIVGTKIATRALNDGDEVEVDAEKGIIKKTK